MNRRRRTLPPVPPKAPSELRPLIAAMTEILETGEGVRGDPLDRKLTLRDILESGIGRLKPGMRPGQDGNLDSGALPPAPDLSIPPAPANFDAQGGFYGMINLSWTIPGQQYRNHAYTNIFRSEEDNFANAEVIGREAGGFYTDYVRDDAVDPDDPTKLKGYYYWITFTSVVDIEGPPNSPNGTYAAPLADVGYVLELLTGEIDAGVLATELRQEIEKIPALESNIERLDPIETAIARIPAIETNIERIGPIETAIERLDPIETAIERIPAIETNIERLDPIETAIERIGPIEAELRGPESLDGTVANRIAAERDERIAALDEERAERVDSLLAEQEARQDAISFEAQARQDAIQAEVQDRVAAVAAERDARVAALQAEQGARAAAITSVEQQLVDGDTALASQLTTLTSVVDGNSADISSEQQARVSGDEALASDITTLQVQVGDNEATIINESQARIENDALRASQLAVIAATYNANTASIYSLEEIRIGDREATATRINGLEVQVEDNEASIFQEQIARANADSALASQLSVLSAKIDALPTFANGFESGLEFDRWVAASGHSIAAETSDAFSGDQSALIGSTASSVATGTAPFAVSARIPNGTADAFAGRRVRVGIAARAVSGGGSEFAIGYATSDGWFSGWHRHEPAAGWGIFEAQVEVPEVTNEDHYVVIWGDTSGGGGSVEVDRLLIDVADTEIPEITAQIETLQQVIADNQQAMATQFNALSSQFDTSIATVNGELTTLSTADEALASSIQTLQAEIGDNAAAIVDEQTARATETDALAQQLNAVDARVDQSRALITSEAQSRADEDSALAQQINTVDARVDGSRSLITSEQQARADGDSALASDIQTLTAVTGDLAADIQNESTVRATADEALAEDVTDLWAGVGENEARITDEARVRATEDDLLAAVQRVISASRGTASATFYSLDEVRLADSAATALRIDGVEVQLGDAFSAIELEQSLRASEDQALATQITTAVAELDGDISTVQQTLNTEVTRLDGRVDATAQAVTAVQSQIDDDLATVQQSFDTQVLRIDGELQTNAQAITDVQAATDDALAGVQQDFYAQTSYLDGRISSNAQALTEARSELEGDVAGVQQNLNTQVSRLDGRVDSTAQALTTVQSELEDNLSTVQQNFNTQVTRLDGRVDSTAQAVTDVQSAGEDALAGVQQDFNTEVSFLKDEQAVVSAVYNASARSITAVQAGFENNLAVVQQEFTSNVTRLDGRVDSQAQALTTVQSQLEDDISTVQQNFNTEVSRIDDGLNANAQAITDVQVATDDALAGVQQDFNVEVNRVDDRIDVASQAVTEVRADMEAGVAGALTAIDVAVAGNDILKNGLFSTGDLSGWEPDSSLIGVVSRDTSDGSTAVRNMPAPFAAVFADSGWDANRRLRSVPQPVSEGDVYTIRFSYATGGASPREVPFNLFVGFRNDSSDWSYTSRASFSVSNLDWVRTDSYTITIPSDTTQARISISRQTGGSGTLLVANVRAYRIDDAMAASIATLQSNLGSDISTVQQNLSTNVNRIDGNVSANAQAITDVQAATDDALAGVQQDFNTEVVRLDGRVDVTAQAVTEVRSDLEGDVAGVQQNLNTNVSRLDGRIDSQAQALTTVQSDLDSDISTVQQNLNTNVNRIDDDLSANAQAITDVQAATDDALAGVQQNFNTEISRVDGRIDTAAQAVTEVRADMEEGVAGVLTAIDAAVAGNDLLKNGLFSTGDFTGWAPDWSSIAVVQRNEDAGSSTLQSMPTEFAARFWDSGWGANRRLRSEPQTVSVGDIYTISLDYATGGGSRDVPFGIWLGFRAAGDQWDYTNIGNFRASSTSWSKTPYYTVTIPDGITQARISVSRKAGGSGEFYVTNLRAYRIDDAMAQSITTVQSQLSGDISTVQQDVNTQVQRIDGNVSANAQAITDVQSATDDALAGVQQDFNTEVARLDGRVDVTAQAVTEVRSDLEGDVAGIQQNLNTNVSRLDGRIDSTAQSISTVQSQLSGDISTVQQNLNTNVSRIDDELDANAQAITDVQSATDDALAGVQQDFNTEIARVDDAIDANANAITEVRSDLGSDIATVQQSLTSNVNRIDGNVASNAQAITTAQSQLNGQISTVQQNLSSEINRVDGEIEATAQLVQSVQTDLGNGLNAVEIKAVTNAGGILSNGQFGTGDLAGWGNTWSGVNVIEANPDGDSSAIRGAPTKYIAQWSDSGWSSDQYMRGERFAATAGETYTFQFAYASGGGSRDIDVDLRVGWVSADGSASWRTIHSQRVTATGWDKTPLLSTVAPDETVEAWVYFRRSAGGVGTLFIADVQARRTDMVAGALYTAKVQSGGLIGGFGVYNDGTEVDAGFDVDRFWIGRTDSDKRKPFIIDGDMVYMNNAMIRNGSIQEGHLGPITIGKFFLDDGTPVTTAGGLIRAEAIDVDNLSVAEAARFYADVQSGNYIAGQSGWRIRQNGSVEFNDGQFNGTVNVGNVSGAGALASKNSLSYSEVRGTKPPTNADRTASNTAADTAKVDGEDASAVRNWASSTFGRVFDNWTRPGSTEIWGNRISTADAYVDTLVIKGNAVTIPVSAAAGSEFQLQRFMREILSCSIDAKGSNVMVMASFSVGDGGITSVQIRRNGVTVLQRAVVGRFFSIAGHVGATSGGVDTYTMWASGGGIAGGRSLGLLATRR
ncbi:phage tail tip fiber protein [Halomonas sp. AOP31-B1-25]|uniref:phage tail tip fiber protein n=1 Tax=Halomonas sp. AOP31-B1-25 TaxID=3457694 RepID=UPI004034AAA2